MRRCRKGRVLRAPSHGPKHPVYHVLSEDVALPSIRKKSEDHCGFSLTLSSRFDASLRDIRERVIRSKRKEPLVACSPSRVHCHPPYFHNLPMSLAVCLLRRFPTYGLGRASKCVTRRLYGTCFPVRHNCVHVFDPI